MFILPHKFVIVKKKMTETCERFLIQQGLLRDAKETADSDIRPPHKVAMLQRGKQAKDLKPRIKVL
ncbi:hypothetical protein CH333_04285 [candidate division WOR-3 bacterium JGI_Cruoil_03_44_89]|uniref:Uncharacterized protein n=1 Tax=candidate division WOR-3 bacterium JGI_Cruoil_03_44_89 TaxID=1973748 RepID=A0A235BV63_UNCW3|nr:MAG: hypothetical protein CH333_04285 [candidate division WOR-3 bacterium JGI_Cruoil_03_44_89]